MMNDDAQLLFCLLRLSMSPDMTGTPDAKALEGLPMETWQSLYGMAKKQSLLGVTLAGLDALPRRSGAPLRVYSYWALAAEKIQSASMRRAECARELYKLFSDNGFPSCLLKGSGVAACYPQPLLRQSGDVDMWVDGPRAQLLEFLRSRCTVGEVVYHHCDAKFFDDVPVEVHFTPTWMNSPWLNRRLQRWFRSQMAQQSRNIDAELGFPVCDAGFNAVFSLVHIWRHVADEGVGLRQLMDYYYILQSLPAEMRPAVMSTIRSLKLARFAAAIMHLLQTVFALPDEKLLCSPDPDGGAFLLDEVMRGGNFGRYDSRNRHASDETRVQRTGRKTLRQLRFIRFCPQDVLAAPFFKLWQYCWRRRHGWL